jgi:galactose mutarotase-like enzyme
MMASPLKEFVLAHRGTTALVSACGANLLSLRDQLGREYMWQGGAQWPKRGGFNVAFPFFGQIAADGRYRHDGEVYTMPKHGFAREAAFDLLNHKTNAAVFKMTDTEATRAAYPFAFDLRVAYRLKRDEILMEQTVRNPSRDSTLIFTLGSHPGFNWPLAGDGWRGHELRFDKAETSPIRRPTDGLLNGRLYANPVRGKVLRLKPGFFKNDGLFFIDDPRNQNKLDARTRLHSDAVDFVAADGTALRMEWGGFKNLGVWTKAVTPEHPTPDFLCLEPFVGNSFAASWKNADGQPLELGKIPHMVRLAPRQKFTAFFRLRFGVGMES